MDVEGLSKVWDTDQALNRNIVNVFFHIKPFCLLDQKLNLAVWLSWANFIKLAQWRVGKEILKKTLTIILY